MKYNHWDGIFDMRKQVDLRNEGNDKKQRHEFVLRLPREMHKLIVQDLHKIQLDDDLKTMSFNELVVLSLMYVSNLSQNQKKEFYRQKNGQNLDNFIQNKKRK